MASLLGSLFGGLGVSSASSAPARTSPVLYGSTRLCLTGHEGLMCTLTEEKRMFSTPVVRGRLSDASEVITDGHIFCCVNVSSPDKQLRIGDVVTIWCKFQGGLCMTADIQDDKQSSSSSSTSSSLFNKLKSMTSSTSSTSSSSALNTGAGQTSSPFASSPSLPSTRRIKWVKEDLGMLAWFVVASPMDDRAQDKVTQAFNAVWVCGKCKAENPFTKKACGGCQCVKPIPSTPPVQIGDRVLLFPFTCSGLVLNINQAGFTLEPYTPDAPGISLSSIADPDSATAGARGQAQGQRSATFSEKIIAAGVVNILREASAGAQFAAANPHPNSDPLVNAAIASAAPSVARAAETRYTRDPTLAVQDLRTAVAVMDKVAANPVAQKAASAFLTMAAAGINAAATGTATSTTTTTTTTITGFK